MSLYTSYAALLDGLLDELVAEGVLAAGLDRRHVTVEPPRDPSHGDLAINAAMVLAKPAGMNPRALAEALKPKLEAVPTIAAVEVAGPGFINLRLHDGAWRDELRTILAEGDAYGTSTIGGNERVNVEYVSANPTGPLHMGHCRGAVVGDSLARLLEVAGFRVTKEYYVNDAGAQVDTLARSVHLRYREALGEDIGDIPEGLYPGDYLIPVGVLMAAEYGDDFVGAPEERWLPLVPQRGDHGDARPHPPRSRAARHPPRPLRLGSRAAEVRRGRSRHGRTRVEGAGLRRPARAAAKASTRTTSGSPST